MPDPTPRTDLQVVPLAGGLLRASASYEIVRGNDERVILQPPPPATGLIWISVITVEPGPETASGVGKVVRAQAAERNRPVQEFPDGKVFTFYDEAAENEGQRLFVRTCQIGVANTLGVIQAVIPEAELSAEENQALLADLPAMVESFAPAERTEFIETATGTVETHVSTRPPDATKMSRRALTDDEKKQLGDFLAFADGLVGRYASSAGEISPRVLDTVFSRWMQDADREKADGESVSLAIGAAFGECVRKTLGLQWAVVGGDEGEAWALTHDQSTLMVFPIESVRKRVASGETNFLHNLAQVAKTHLDSGRLEGEKT